MVSSPSFESFFQSTRSRLVATLFGLTGDLDVAAEAVDEAMVRAFARWKRLSRHPEPAAWVFVTARNIVRRHHTRGPHQRYAMAHPGVSVAEFPDREIWQLVAALPDRQREAIALRHVLGLTERGVGEAMGTTRGTASSTLRDAYQNLRTALIDEEATVHD